MNSSLQAGLTGDGTLVMVKIAIRIRKLDKIPYLTSLNKNGEGGSQAGGQVNADATIPKIVVTGSGTSQTGEGAE